MLVPIGDDVSGHFSFQRGGPLRRHPGTPAADLEAGFRRGTARFARLVASPELRDVGREGFCHVISSNGGELSTHPTSLAA